jgi:hypothetical protein
MVKYSAMKSYLGKSSIYFFMFFPKFRKAYNGSNPSHPPHARGTYNISNSLENLGFSVNNVRQMTAKRTAHNGQPHVEPLPLFLVTLTKNIKSRELFKMNNLINIIIKV